MVPVDPVELFSGRTMVIVPHMDDCVLAVGGTIARLPGKDQIHFIYATDGMASPAPVVQWHDRVSLDLRRVRMQEARTALGYLDIPDKNIHFLGLPDGKLVHHMREMQSTITEYLIQLKPETVVVPFRFDRHPDHLAINHVITNAWQNNNPRAGLLEYFVYYRWQLLPLKDVRKYIRQDQLCCVNIEEVAAKKKKALHLFISQTTRFYPWQTRPNLTSHLINEVCHSPEYLLKYDPSLPGAAIFSHSAFSIRLLHRLEPYLKAKKDRVIGLWMRGLQKYESGT